MKETETMPEVPPELSQLPSLVLPAARRAAVRARIGASLAVPIVPGAAAATAGWVKAAATLVVGIGTGVVLDRAAFPVEPKVVEKIVVRTEQVRVEVPVFVDAGVRVFLRPEQHPARPAAPKVDAAAQSSRERQLLEGARTAMLRREPESALRLLDQLRKDIPAGELIEERESMRVQALRQAHRDDEARAAAKAFLEKFPGSVFAPAVQRVRDAQ